MTEEEREYDLVLFHRECQGLRKRLEILEQSERLEELTQIKHLEARIKTLERKDEKYHPTTIMNFTPRLFENPRRR